MNALVRRSRRQLWQVAVTILWPASLAVAQESPPNPPSARVELPPELREQARLVDQLSRSIADKKRDSGIVTSVDSALMHQHRLLREARTSPANSTWPLQKIERELKEMRLAEASGVDAILKDSWVFFQESTSYLRLDEIRRRVEELRSLPADAAGIPGKSDRAKEELDRLKAEGSQLAAGLIREKSKKRDATQRAFDAAKAAYESAQADYEALSHAVAQLREMERELKIQALVFDSLQLQTWDETDSDKRSRRIYHEFVYLIVMGDVGQQGEIQFRTNERSDVLTAIARAGGLAAKNRKTVTRLIRRNTEGTLSSIEHPTPTTTGGVDRFGDLSDRDIVVVTQAPDAVRSGRVYVVGQVNAPGQVALFDDWPTRIVDAIEKAGGITRLAVLRRIALKRIDPATGVQTVTILDLDPFYSGRYLGDADLMLEPGDIVIVPEVE